MTVNKPRAILERLAFACFLALFIASCGLAGLGLIFGLHAGDARPACLGAAGLLLFIALRPLGYKHLHFREWEDSFELSDAANVLVLDTDRADRTEELANLLLQMELLRKQVDTGTGDVWAIQTMRQQAAALVARDPSLREHFAGELADSGVR